MVSAGLTPYAVVASADKARYSVFIARPRTFLLLSVICTSPSRSLRIRSDLAR